MGTYLRRQCPSHLNLKPCLCDSNDSFLESAEMLCHALLWLVSKKKIMVLVATLIYIQTQAGLNLLTRTNSFYEHIMNCQEADKPCESSLTTTTSITGILLSGFIKHQVSKSVPINARANYAVNNLMLLNGLTTPVGLPFDLITFFFNVF